MIHLCLQEHMFRQNESPDLLADYNGSVVAVAAKSFQSCPILCDPTDGSPPVSPIPAILQARTLEWVAFPSPMHESEK